MSVQLCEDLLLGAEAIDRHVFGDPPTDPIEYRRRMRRTYYMLENGAIPAGKIDNKQWCSRRSVIDQHFTAISSGSAA